MRRTLLAVLFLIFSVVFPFTATWAGNSQFTVDSYEYVKDGITYSMDVAPYVKNDRTYIPIRYVAQALDISTSNILWDEDVQAVILLRGNKAIQLKIGSKALLVNGVTITMDVAPEITSGRTMLPLRFIAQALDVSVRWNDSAQQISIGAEEIDKKYNNDTSISNSSLELTIKEVINKNLNSVVMISTNIGQGSGFFLSNGGIIATNDHVVSGSHTIYIKTADSSIYEAIITHRSPEFDLALLKTVNNIQTIPVNIGDSDSLEIGDEVVAMGSPLGFDNTVSTGIISGFRKMEGVRVFQTTAPISHGSSGGPLFNKKGEVVGVTFATIEGGQNLNFAIPINYVNDVLNQRTAGAKGLNTSQNNPVVQAYVDFILQVDKWTKKLTEINNHETEVFEALKQSRFANAIIILKEHVIPGYKKLNSQAKSYQSNNPDIIEACQLFSRATACYHNCYITLLGFCLSPNNLMGNLTTNFFKEGSDYMDQHRRKVVEIFEQYKQLNLN